MCLGTCMHSQPHAGAGTDDSTMCLTHSEKVAAPTGEVRSCTHLSRHLSSRPDPVYPSKGEDWIFRVNKIVQKK